MGRPTINPKPKNINFRLDEDTYNILENIAKKENKTVSELVRLSVSNLLKENIKENEEE